MTALPTTAPGKQETDFVPGAASGDALGVGVLVPRATVHLLADYLDAIRGDSALAGATITVVHAPGAAQEVEDVTAGMPRIRLLDAPAGSRRILARTLIDDAEHLATPYLVVHSLTATTQPVAIIEESLRVLDEWAELGWDLRMPLDTGVPGQRLPLLLVTGRTPRDAVMHYVDRARVLEGMSERPWSDFLGHLTILATKPQLEGVDPHDGGITVRVALGARTLQAPIQPEWRYRLVLRDGSGHRVASGPAVLQERYGKVGASSWDDLVAHVPLREANSGIHQLVLELDSDLAPPLDSALKPRTGALLCSRPVIVDSSGRNPVRYLVHPSVEGRRSFVRVQHGSGPLARLRWSIRMALNAITYILRGRGPGQMRRLLLLRLLTLPFFFWRDIWLVGERYDTAQDNGMHLFRHARAAGSRRRRDVYYVISADSPQRGAVADVGHIVDHSSWRHRLYMLHAQVVTDAYSLHYLIPQQWRPEHFVEHLAWRIGALQVFLQHGVHMSPRAVRRGSTGYDLLLTSTARETQALREVSGYDQHLVETGLPRYDALVPGPRTRTILFMSTWRQYLVPKLFGGQGDARATFEGSTYDEFMTGFVEHPRLQEILERHDYRLLMLPHYNMAEYFKAMTPAGDRVSVAGDDSGSIQELLIGCDGFITDYSSVHFDVAYLGTPIIYARFDEEEYERRHASPGWFDYDREGFGPVTRTLDETLAALEAMLRDDCRQPALYNDRVDEAFTYRDHDNSGRVMAVIEETLVRAR